jgi:MSHA biogenesis protein MshQ
VNWSNPTRAQTSDNSYATVSVDGTTSRYLYCTTYGFAIPTGSTIIGITVNVERNSSATANGGSNDAAVRLVKAGVIGSTDNSTATTYTTTDVIEAHGSSSDLWGLTWTAADINASNFGVAFAATKTNSAGSAHTVSVDTIEIIVTYDPPLITTITTGSDPAAATIAPSSAATEVNQFTLQTTTGKESITSVTVNLSSNAGIGLIAITDNAGTVLGSLASPITGSNTISVTGMNATTTVTTFKVKVTPLSHALMPPLTGASYSVTAPESATLNFTKYNPTGTGAVNGTFTGTLGSFVNGVASSSTLKWTEVGTIDLNATITSGNYLGANVIYSDASTAAKGKTGVTGVVGAFIPDHFDTTVTQGCSAGGFTYSGQPFAATLTARNALGNTTLNYDGSPNTSPNFAKVVTLSDANAVLTLSPSSVALVALTEFSAGVANITPTFSFTANPSAPATIRLRAVDSSAVSSATGAEGTALIRSGRIQSMARSYWI